MVDRDGALHYVDWDAPMMAPRERDLKFMVDASFCGPSTPGHEAAFLSGYGIDRVDPLALAYYRHDWVIEDLAAYGNDVFPPAGHRRDHASGFVRPAATDVRCARHDRHCAAQRVIEFVRPCSKAARNATVADRTSPRQARTTWPSTSKSKPPKSLPGLRLVLTAGAPGAPWTEAAKGIFEVKKIPFARVAQRPGRDGCGVA